MLKRMYFDANAGAPLLPQARAAVISVMDGIANASSVHAEGRRVRAVIETAREEVARAVATSPGNVVFTSGATESAALGLTPAVISGDRGPAGRLYVGATEHPCVLAGGRFPSASVEQLPVLTSGVIDLEALAAALAQHDRDTGAPYVALMLANNETGVIHPVAEAARLVKAHGGYLYCDAVQALGRIPVDIAALGADFLALSAHKIGGPQGAGALVLADESVHPSPLLTGGGQERQRRSGTENVAAIAGFGIAAKCAAHHLNEVDRVAALRVELERELLTVSPEARIVGEDAPRLSNTVLLAVPGLAAETAVIAFDLEGVAVSAGSACSSGKIAASHVLQAMGEPAEITKSGIRISMPHTTEATDIADLVAAWSRIHGRMRQRSAA